MSKTASVLIAIILTVIIAASGTYYYVTNYLIQQPTTVTTTTTTTTIEPEVLPTSLSPVIAVENPEQDPKPSNPDNPKIEYLIQSPDKDYGMVTANYFNRRGFELSDGNIYFIDPTGQISMYNLESEKTSLIEIPDITPTDLYLNENTISNFFVDNNTIYYSKGICMEGGAGPGVCSIRSYDLKTKENTIIVEDLYSQIVPMIMNATYLTGVKGDVLTFTDAFGDAGHAAISLYEVNIGTGEITKVDEAIYSPVECYEDDLNCDEEVNKKKNEKFENLTATEKPSCGDFEYQTDIKGDLIIDDENYHNAFFVGCY